MRGRQCPTPSGRAASGLVGSGASADQSEHQSVRRLHWRSDAAYPDRDGVTDGHLCGVALALWGRLVALPVPHQADREAP